MNGLEKQAHIEYGEEESPAKASWLNIGPPLVKGVDPNIVWIIMEGYIRIYDVNI